MIGLQYAILVWSELLQLNLEYLIVLIRYRFLVEDQNVRYIIVMRLKFMSFSRADISFNGDSPSP